MNSVFSNLNPAPNVIFVSRNNKINSLICDVLLHVQIVVNNWKEKNPNLELHVKLRPLSYICITGLSIRKKQLTSALDDGVLHTFNIHVHVSR